MVHAGLQMNTRELCGSRFEDTLNMIQHTNAEKLNFAGLLWHGILARKRDLS